MPKISSTWRLDSEELRETTRQLRLHFMKLESGSVPSNCGMGINHGTYHFNIEGLTIVMAGFWYPIESELAFRDSEHVKIAPTFFLEFNDNTTAENVANEIIMDCFSRKNVSFQHWSDHSKEELGIRPHDPTLHSLEIPLSKIEGEDSSSLEELLTRVISLIE